MGCRTGLLEKSGLITSEVLTAPLQRFMVIWRMGALGEPSAAEPGRAYAMNRHPTEESTLDELQEQKVLYRQ